MPEAVFWNLDIVDGSSKDTFRI